MRAATMDPAIVAHDDLYQSLADAATAMTFCHDEHRQVAVRYSIAKGARETDDFAVVDGDQRPLSTSDGRIAQISTVGFRL